MFTDLGPGVAGQCLVYSGGLDPEISIDQNYWNEMNYDDRRAVLLHELGHCIAGRDHLNKHLLNRPESLMNGVITDDMNYGKYETQYQQEMMTRTDLFNAIF